MSLPFDTLYAFSNTLTDDFIDEDQTEISAGEHTYYQHTVMVRGALAGVPLVVSYQRYGFSGSGLGGPAYHDIVEIFTTARAMPMEGRIRPLSFWVKILRLLGRGGIRAAHPLYKAYRVDATEGSGVVFDDALASALLELLERSCCLEMQLQHSAGFSGIYPFAKCHTPEALTQLATAQIAVSAHCGS